MTTDTSVVYLDSSMSGAPSMTNVAGTLMSVLDACLVNGFGSQTLDSLVVVDNVATATKTGHSFVMRGNTGPVIEIDGATPSALNGRVRIQSIPNSNTFTFLTSGIDNQTATGTITAKRASARWGIEFSGTNKAAYRSQDVAGTQLLLRVDDTQNTLWSYLNGYESLSDMDTGSGKFPSTGELYCPRSLTTDGVVRNWVLIADSRFLFFFTQPDGVNWYGQTLFGDFINRVPADAFGCLIAAQYSMSANANQFVNLSYAEQSGQLLARNYIQLGGAVGYGKLSSPRMVYMGNNSTLTIFPNAADNAVLFSDVTIWEDSGRVLRGVIPGLYDPIAQYTNLTHGEIISTVTGLASPRDLIIQTCHSNNHYRAAIDITGPWR